MAGGATGDKVKNRRIPPLNCRNSAALLYKLHRCGDALRRREQGFMSADQAVSASGDDRGAPKPWRRFSAPSWSASLPATDHLPGTGRPCVMPTHYVVSAALVNAVAVLPYKPSSPPRSGRSSGAAGRRAAAYQDRQTVLVIAAAQAFAVAIVASIARPRPRQSVFQPHPRAIRRPKSSSRTPICAITRRRRVRSRGDVARYRRNKNDWRERRVTST